MIYANIVCIFSRLYGYHVRFTERCGAPIAPSVVNKLDALRNDYNDFIGLYPEGLHRYNASCIVVAGAFPGLNRRAEVYTRGSCGKRFERNFLSEIGLTRHNTRFGRGAILYNTYYRPGGRSIFNYWI